MTILTSIDYIRTGKLRALAVTTAMRQEVLSDIPTVADFVPGYEASTVNGIGAPRGTPTEIVDKLNKDINPGPAHTTLMPRSADSGGSVAMDSPADYGKL